MERKFYHHLHVCACTFTMAILKHMRFGKLPHHVKSVSKSDLHSSEVTKFTHEQVLKRLCGFLAISMEYFSTMETL